MFFLTKNLSVSSSNTVVTFPHGKCVLQKIVCCTVVQVEKSRIEVERNEEQVKPILARQVTDTITRM